jgi:hypothetical protein
LEGEFKFHFLPFVAGGPVGSYWFALGAVVCFWFLVFGFWFLVFGFFFLTRRSGLRASQGLCSAKAPDTPTAAPHSLLRGALKGKICFVWVLVCSCGLVD